MPGDSVNVTTTFKQLWHLHVPTVWKSWEPQPPTGLEACLGISLSRCHVNLRYSNAKPNSHSCSDNNKAPIIMMMMMMMIIIIIIITHKPITPPPPQICTGRQTAVSDHRQTAGICQGAIFFPKMRILQYLLKQTFYWRLWQPWNAPLSPPNYEKNCLISVPRNNCLTHGRPQFAIPNQFFLLATNCYGLSTIQ